MICAVDEVRRLEAVHALGLLDTAPEPAYSELAELAAELCGVPVSAISLMDDRRQWFKACQGLDGATDLPRGLTVCQYTLQQDGLLTVEDLREDPRFADNPLVWSEGGMRFYAGLRLLGQAGLPVGTLCVGDRVPRRLTAGQRRGLEILATQVEQNFRLRAKQRELELLSAEKANLTRSLESRNRLFQAFMDHGPFVSYMKDAGGRMLFYNKAMRAQFEVRGEEWIGKTDHELWPAEMADKYREHDLRVMQGGVPVVLEECSPGPDNTTLTWRSYKFPIVDEAGTVGLAGISVDMTADKAQKAALEEALLDQRKLSASLAHNQAMLRTLLEHSPNQCYLKSEDGRYLFYNSQFAEHFGIGPATWLGRTDAELVPPELAAELRAHDREALDSDAVVQTLGHLARADGRLATFRILKFRCQDGEGNRMLAGIATDITDQLEREQALQQAVTKMEEIASVDGLTGLSNRRAFDLSLAHEFQQAESTGHRLSLLLLDVDNFKWRNDQWGHAAGDEVLRELGRVLQLCARKSDLAARVGGEEFAFLLRDTGPEEARLLAERVLDCVRRLEAGQAPVTVSIGVASLNATTRNAAQLYSRADDAMYSAKRQGKDRVVMHSVHVQTLMRTMAEGLQLREMGPAA